MSHALTNGVSVTWLSEQTGVALNTILKHYGRFIHCSQANDLEMSNDRGRATLKKGTVCTGLAILRLSRKKCPDFLGCVASPTGFEPVLPT
jgi:hypothetical protein